MTHYLTNTTNRWSSSLYLAEDFPTFLTLLEFHYHFNFLRQRGSSAFGSKVRNSCFCRSGFAETGIILGIVGKSKGKGGI
jgi:hypothetical protein